MKTIVELEKNFLKFKFLPGDTDLLEPVPHYRMIGDSFGIKLPDNVDPESIHPDHLALIAILCAHPFTKGEMILPKPVSKRFLDSTKVVSRYKCSPCDEDLEPWSCSEGSFPGLAFSGGVDSTAALAVMPPDTIPIFLDRPKRKGSLYNKSAAIQSCRELESIGYQVYRIQCDVEFIREPIGFPTDVANAIPAVMLASTLNLNSISFGTVLESSFGTGHLTYRDYPNLSHWRLWGSMFKGAGIPMALPVGGVSEVGTGLIVKRSPLGYIAQSCIRGEWKRPCWNCWKCFRKGLLATALDFKDETIPEFVDLFKIEEAKKYLTQIPIKHENVLAYSVQRLDTDDEFISTLKNRITYDGLELEWLENWYEGSLELVPVEFREYVETKLDNYLGKMSPDATKLLKSWDMTEFVQSDSYQEGHEELHSIMQDN